MTKPSMKVLGLVPPTVLGATMPNPPHTPQPTEGTEAKLGLRSQIELEQQLKQVDCVQQAAGEISSAPGCEALLRHAQENAEEMCDIIECSLRG